MFPYRYRRLSLRCVLGQLSSFITTISRKEIITEPGLERNQYTISCQYVCSAVVQLGLL